MELDYGSYAIGIIALIIAVILPIVLYHRGKGDLTKMKNELRDGISADVVDVANAQLHVKDGGKVAKRDGKVAADVERTIKEQVNIGEDVTYVKKNVRTLSENTLVGDSIGAEVTRAKDRRFVAENKKKFTVDAIVVNAKEEDVSDATQKQDNSAESEKKNSNNT